MSAEPPTPPHGQWPDWLQPLVDAAVAARSSDLGRWAAAPPNGARSAAVLVLLAGGSDGPELLLIERSEALRNHAGQPAFPGGAVEPGDADPAATALREAAEEVGLDPAGVTVVALLPRLYLPPTGFAVTPVIAWWHAPSAVRVADPVEVARVERVPVAELADPANRFRISHPSGFVGPAFAVRGMTVWGFTAGLIDWLLMLGGWALPWNADDVRGLPPRAVELANRSRPRFRPEPADDPVAPYEPVTPYPPAAAYPTRIDPGGLGADGVQP